MATAKKTTAAAPKNAVETITVPVYFAYNHEGPQAVDLVENYADEKDFRDQMLGSEDDDKIVIINVVAPQLKPRPVEKTQTVTVKIPA